MMLRRMTSRSMADSPAAGQVNEPAVGRAFERWAYNSTSHNPDAVTIELCLECREIPNMDFGSLSDAFAVLYELRGISATGLGLTETVWDDLNPRFVKCYYLHYVPPSISNKGMERRLRVEIYDRDSLKDDLSAHDFIGSAVFNLSDVMNAQDHRITLDLEGRAAARVSRRNQGGGANKLGTLTIMANAVNEKVHDHTVELRMNTAELKRKRLVDRSVIGQFYTVARRRMESTGRIHWTPIYRSEVQYRASATGYVKYDHANITIQTLNNGDPKLPLRIEFWQREKRTGHQRIGFVDVSLHRLQLMASGAENKHVVIEGEYQDEQVGHVVMALSGTQGDALHSFFEFNVNFASCSRYDSSIHAANRRTAVSRSQSSADGIGSGVMNAI